MHQIKVNKPLKKKNKKRNKSSCPLSSFILLHGPVDLAVHTVGQSEEEEKELTEGQRVKPAFLCGPQLAVSASSWRAQPWRKSLLSTLEEVALIICQRRRNDTVWVATPSVCALGVSKTIPVRTDLNSPSHTCRENPKRLPGRPARLFLHAWPGSRLSRAGGC